MRLVLLIFALFLASGQSLAYEVSFDCGGSGGFLDGKMFEADTPFPGSSDAGYMSGYVSTPNGNAGFGGPFQPPSICSKFRRGDFDYQFNVPNGDYAITLYFSEHEVHGPGLRQFPIQLSRTVQEDSFDIWERSRMFYAFSSRYLVSVSDGVIIASFGSSTGSALLAGISVQDIQDNGTPPSAPSNIQATGSYNCVNLSWNLPTNLAACGVNIHRSTSPTGPFIQVGLRDDLAPFWVDHDVIAGNTYYYKLATSGLYGNIGSLSYTVSASVLSPAESTLPYYSVTMSDTDLALLRESPFSDLYYVGQLNYNGIDYGTAGVRYRGSLSRTISSKKSWKIKPATGLVNGRDRFNLNSDFLDRSLIVPLVSFACFLPTQCMTPEAHKAQLMVNGEHRGLFTEAEQVDELFLQGRGITSVGNVYKCNGDLGIVSEVAYPNLYEKKTNTAFGNEDLIHFVETINNTPTSELDDLLFPLLNLESQVDYYATRIYIADYDYFMRNYYLYHHLATDQWELIPWDLDLSLDITSVLSSIDLGTSQTPSPNGWNHLFDRLVSVPKYRHFYCDRLKELLDTHLSPNAFSQVADSLATMVEPEVRRDFWKFRFDDYHLFNSYLNQIHSFGSQREAFLQSAIEPFLADVNGLFINEVLVLNENTVTDENFQHDSYIELFNWSDHPVDLNNYCLGNGTNDPLAAILPNETLPARSFTIFWADDEPQQGPHHLPFDLVSAGGQLMLYRTDELNTAVDSLAYDTQVPDVALALPIDGWWPFHESQPSPGSTNVFQGDDSVVFINEFMALNTLTMTDPQGEYEDWVELYNPGTETVNLTGFHLSDDPNAPTRWTFPPGTTIAAGEFLIVWCDSDPLDLGLHTNFKLSASGETIGLYGPSGAGAPVIDEYVFGAQLADISEGRFPDGSETWISFNHPTPGVSNAALVPVEDVFSSRGLRLYPASPNPVAHQTTISFSLPGEQMAPVELDVFDVRGRKVRQLIKDQAEPGPHSLVWDRRDDTGRTLASGVYFVRLKSLGSQSTSKVVLVR